MICVPSCSCGTAKFGGMVYTPNSNMGISNPFKHIGRRSDPTQVSELEGGNWYHSLKDLSGHNFGGFEICGRKSHDSFCGHDGKERWAGFIMLVRSGVSNADTVGQSTKTL